MFSSPGGPWRQPQGSPRGGREGVRRNTHENYGQGPMSRGSQTGRGAYGSTPNQGGMHSNNSIHASGQHGGPTNHLSRNQSLPGNVQSQQVSHFSGHLPGVSGGNDMDNDNRLPPDFPVHDRTLRVRNISDLVSTTELGMHFATRGPVESVAITGPGLAFINMRNPAHSEAARVTLHGTLLGGLPIDVSYAIQQHPSRIPDQAQGVMTAGQSSLPGGKMGGMNGRSQPAGQERGDGSEGGMDFVPTKAISVKGIPASRIPEQLKSIITLYGPLENLQIRPEENFFEMHFSDVSTAVSARRELMAVCRGEWQIQFVPGTLQRESVGTGVGGANQVVGAGGPPVDTGAGMTPNQQMLRQASRSGVSQTTSYPTRAQQSQPNLKSRATGAATGGFESGNRKMEEETESASLWVGFPPGFLIDEEQVFSEFSRYGRVLEVRANQVQRYCFVNFDTINDSRRALNMLKGKLFNEPSIVIAYPKNSRRLERGNNPTRTTNDLGSAGNHKRDHPLEHKQGATRSNNPWSVESRRIAPSEGSFPEETRSGWKRGLESDRRQGAQPQGARLSTPKRARGEAENMLMGAGGGDRSAPSPVALAMGMNARSGMPNSGAGQHLGSSIVVASKRPDGLPSWMDGPGTSLVLGGQGGSVNPPSMGNLPEWVSADVNHSSTNRYPQVQMPTGRHGSEREQNSSWTEQGRDAGQGMLQQGFQQPIQYPMPNQGQELSGMNVGNVYPGGPLLSRHAGQGVPEEAATVGTHNAPNEMMLSAGGGGGETGVRMMGSSFGSMTPNQGPAYQQPLMSTNVPSVLPKGMPPTSGGDDFHFSMGQQRGFAVPVMQNQSYSQVPSLMPRDLPPQMSQTLQAPNGPGGIGEVNNAAEIQQLPVHSNHDRIDASMPSKLVQWRGSLAKGSTFVCNVQCMHESRFKVVQNIMCTARTDLKRLEHHLGPGGGADQLALLQITADGPPTVAYHEFLKQLYDKERVGVAKWDEYTLFLVPPGRFARDVLGVDVNDCLVGVLTVPRQGLTQVQGVLPGTSHMHNINHQQYPMQMSSQESLGAGMMLSQQQQQQEQQQQHMLSTNVSNLAENGSTTMRTQDGLNATIQLAQQLIHTPYQ